MKFILTSVILLAGIVAASPATLEARVSNREILYLVRILITISVPESWKLLQQW